MRKGFTLVEILVVLVIIGILVALILPNTLRAINQANTKACAANIRSINTAIHMCYTTTKLWSSCDSIAELTATGAGVANYLEAAPTCPFTALGYTIVADPSGSGGYVAETTGHFASWPSADTHS